MSPDAGHSETGIVGAKVGDKYVLERLLGRGGNGEVWRARNDITRGPVAIKIVASDPERRARGVQEAYVGANLSHRNVVRVFDAFHGANGAFFLVMEALEGETVLARIVRQGSLPVHEALTVAAGVLRGLAHAHDAGVLHRDLSTTNVFLANDGDGRAVPKLLDFGLAKLTRGSIRTSQNDVLGTPQYMAPEHVRGHALDARSDLFVVGILLYEMLSGVSPFERDTPAASLAAILEETVDAHPSIPPRIWLVIQRALAKQPYERFASANDLLDELRRASDGPIDDDVAPSLYAVRHVPTEPPPGEAPVTTGDAERAVESVTSSGVASPSREEHAGRRARGRRIVVTVLAFATLATISAGVKTLLQRPDAPATASAAIAAPAPPPTLATPTPTPTPTPTSTSREDSVVATAAPTIPLPKAAPSKAANVAPAVRDGTPRGPSSTPSGSGRPRVPVTAAKPSVATTPGF